MNRNRYIHLAVTSAVALAISPTNLPAESASVPSPKAPFHEPHQQYTQANLVSNVSGAAAVTDPNLVNVWGLSRSSGGDWWVSDNGTGLSTLYDGTGKITPLVVAIPPSDPKSGSTGTPTGTIFNGTGQFNVAPGKPAFFLFSTEDGTISGWNPGVNPASAVLTVNEHSRSVFKGMTMGQTSVAGYAPANYLYVANFRVGFVAVYDAAFHHIAELEKAFASIDLPAGYAPFNVQNLGGNIYVAYAKQDAAKHDEVDGAGLGYVAVFHPNGKLIQMLQPGPWFNAPWGLALAPTDFGAYSHDVLVGNFGSGEILAFDPVTGEYRGKLRDASDNPIQIDGLWGISFGNGTLGGPATSLFFGAGPNHEQNGLFGSLTAIQNAAGNDQ